MSSSNDTVFIYVLQRISDKVYLYIGSTKNPNHRIIEHRRRNHYAIIRAAFVEKDIRLLVISVTDEEHRICFESRFWKQFKEAGHPIVNRDPSIAWTRYATSARKGYHLSTETKEKISRANKNPDANVRRKISEVHKGKTLSLEHREKMSISQRGRVLSADQKRRRSESMKGKPHPHKGAPRSAEARRKISEAQKKASHKPHTEEAKRKISRANKGKPKSEETRQKLSEAAKAYHAKIKKKAMEESI